MKFRLSDERSWSSEFVANDAESLRHGIAAAWDVRIELVRRNPGTTHPAFALPRRLAEIDGWLAERLARAIVTDDQRRSWEAQASHWRHSANRDLGGDDSCSPLRLHVLAGESPSLWSTIAVCTPSGWHCDPISPRVARTMAIERVRALWDGAARSVELVGPTHAVPRP